MQRSDYQGLSWRSPRLPEKVMRANRQATLQLVADHAGVSKATASMILSGQQRYVERFAPSTVRKVHRSAEALGYRTNVFASSLGPSRTPFFALMIAGSGHDNEWTYDAFESLFVGGVLAAASDAATYPVVLTTSGESSPSRAKAAEDLLFGGVFGTIARTPPPAVEEQLREQLARDHPLVVVFPANPSKWASNVIEADNATMGRVAGSIFAANGCKRWVVVCFRDTSPSHEVRREGLAQAAKRHGAQLQVICLDTNPLVARELSTPLAPRLQQIRPDAIFGVNTAASAGAMIAASNIGIEVGRDVKLIGVDYPHWAEEISAKGSLITSLSVSWKAAGRTAMEKLLAMRSSGDNRFSTVLLQPTIRVGQSCPVPADLPGLNAVSVVSS